MTRPGQGTDADALEYLASTLLCDDAPPPSVHDRWKEHHAADGEGDGHDSARSRISAGSWISAAAAAVVLITAGTWFAMPGDRPGAGDEVGDGASSRTMARPGPAEPDIDLAALGPAIAGAMGATDLRGLAHPELAAECLAEHGEDEADLLGAAPAAHGDRVGQLFVLSAGMHGRVTVLLTMNTCGADPAAPVLHRTIGAPG